MDDENIPVKKHHGGKARGSGCYTGEYNEESKRKWQNMYVNVLIHTLYDKWKVRFDKQDGGFFFYCK